MPEAHAADRVLEYIDRLLTGVFDPEDEAGLAEAILQVDPAYRPMAEKLISVAQAQNDWRRKLVQTAKLSEVGLAMAELIHELRQPLAGISGFAQLIDSEALPARQAGQVKEILAQAIRMERMLEKMRRFVRLDDDCEKTVDVEAAVQGAVALFPRMPPGISLEVEIEPNIPKAIGALNPLVQVLTNLLANARDAQAIKGPGIVRIEAHLRDAAIEIMVADQGAGVPSSFLPKLFEPFATTKGESGTGLGLYISREILEPWSAKLTLEQAAPPFSTAFSISLRPAYQQVARSSLAQEKAASLAFASIRAEAEEMLGTIKLTSKLLLVDDEPAIRKALRLLLAGTHPDLEILEASDGDQAMKLLSAQTGPLQPGRHEKAAEVLIIDKNLRGFNGLELIRWCHASANRRPEFIVTTGFPSLQSVLEAIELGARDYLVKPLQNIDGLRDRVLRIIEREHARHIRQELSGELESWAERALASLPSGCTNYIDSKNSSDSDCLNSSLSSGNQPSFSDAASTLRLKEALEKLSRKSSDPARISVFGDSALASHLSAAGHLVERLSWIEVSNRRRNRIDAPCEAALDLVILGDGLPANEAFKIVELSRSGTWPSRILWARPIANFREALELLEARVSFAMAPSSDTKTLLSIVPAAIKANREAAAQDALTTVLSEMRLAFASGAYRSSVRDAPR